MSRRAAAIVAKIMNSSNNSKGNNSIPAAGHSEARTIYDRRKTDETVLRIRLEFKERGLEWCS